MKLKPDETLSPFIRGKIKVIQKKEGYRFSLDSVLLSAFPQITRKKAKIIDLGTGSGIIILLLSLRYPELEYHALELQEDLYDIARRNFSLNKLNVNLIKGNVRDIKKLLPPQSFDYVITNPPYFRREFTRKSIEEESLARYEISASIEDFVKAGSYLLKDKGRFYMIYPTERLSTVTRLVTENRIQPKRYRFIHPTVDEKATHFLLEGMRSGKEGGEIVEKPLIIYDKSNIKKYSKEVEFLLENFV
ncbi:tRNA1(Val) (adenine(37)-N6)-methyltransferase [Persephonella sp.]